MPGRGNICFCEELPPEAAAGEEPVVLKKNNIFIAGIEVIGNYLTERNITSPTVIQEINKLNNSKLEKIFWNKIEAKIK